MREKTITRTISKHDYTIKAFNPTTNALEDTHHIMLDVEMEDIKVLNAFNERNKEMGLVAVQIVNHATVDKMYYMPESVFIRCATEVPEGEKAPQYITYK